MYFSDYSLIALCVYYLRFLTFNSLITEIRKKKKLVKVITGYGCALKFSFMMTFLYMMMSDTIKVDVRNY